MSQQNSTNEEKKYPLGFTKKQATVREFVTLLVLGLIVYAVAHWQIPPSPRLSSKAEEEKVLVLEEVEQMQEVIDKQQQEIDKKLAPVTDSSPSPIPPQTPTQEPSPSPKPESPQLSPTGNSLSPNLKSSQTTTFTPVLLVSLILTQNPQPPSTENLSLFERQAKKVEKWRQDLQILLQEIPAVERGRINNILTEIPKTWRLLDQNKTPEDQKKILADIKQQLASLATILQERSLFWSDNKKWLEVIFWTLFGTLLYLIQQTAEYYLKIEKETKAKNKIGELADSYLIRNKPQYYSYLLRGPFVSLTILWILNAANFNIAGVSLGFNNIDETVLVSLAFILGFFNRVAITQINLIVAAIFKDAWNRTVRTIDIDPSFAEVEYNQYQQFSVIPDVKVKWSILSKPAIGAIDTATGLYIAPPEAGYCYEQDGDGKLQLKKLEALEAGQKIYQQVIIRAVREEEDSISTIALVILKTDASEGSIPFWQVYLFEWAIASNSYLLMKYVFDKI